MSYSIGYDKEYKCVFCNKIFELDEANDAGWKCPVCGEYIRIAAPGLCSGHIKVRKKAKEVRKWESINLIGTNDIYNVLGITELDNGKLSIGLKNYGSIKVEKEEFVDVIEGAYYEESWNI